MVKSLYDKLIEIPSFYDEYNVIVHTPFNSSLKVGVNPGVDDYHECVLFMTPTKDYTQLCSLKQLKKYLYEYASKEIDGKYDVIFDDYNTGELWILNDIVNVDLENKKIILYSNEEL